VTKTRFGLRCGALLSLACILLAGAACAQPLPDSTEVEPPADAMAPPDTTALPQPPAKHVTPPRSSEERDRFELGVSVMEGFFDVGGSFAYRRYIGERWPFERTIMAELTGTKKEYLTEGALSVYWFFRPIRSYRMSWRIRPIIEGGPGGHLVFQTAKIEGFDRSAYDAHVYLKAHAYAGVEFLATRRWGFLVRGRLSVPSHQPLDYAQAAIFLR
jgi:hypothetical protein